MSNPHSGTAEPEQSTVWRRLRVWMALERKVTPLPVQPLATGLTPFVLAQQVMVQFAEDLDYLRFRRRQWAVGSILIRLLALSLSSTATVLLGLSELSGPAAWGFALSAVVTTVTALEPFFNFRSRWVSADEALASWHRASEELRRYVETSRPEDLALDKVLSYDEKRRDEWVRFSQAWLSERRSVDRKTS